MRIIAVIALALIFPSEYFAQERAPVENKKNVIVADQYFWTGPEGNLGIEITGKFHSFELIKITFELEQEIGEFKAKTHPFNVKAWGLKDILISIDFDANGNVATWRVSGPKPLISHYVESLEQQYKDRSVFYDFGYRVVNFKPTAFFEREK